MKQQMTGLQKLIKYAAIAFAVTLIVGFFGGILKALRITDFALSWASTETGEIEDADITEKLEIEVYSTNVVIKSGEKFAIETDNEYISSKDKNGRYIIEEKRHNLFETGGKTTLTVTLPKDYEYDKISIETGAGTLQADTLYAKRIKLFVGAGQASINNLISTDKTEIDGGAGKITVSDGKVSELEFDLGIGKVDFKAEITDEGDFNCGVGDLNLTLIGSENDYKIEIDKGIGNATLNGSPVDDNTSYGNGNAKIDIDGGVGKINVNIVK